MDAGLSGRLLAVVVVLVVVILAGAWIYNENQDRRMRCYENTDVVVAAACLKAQKAEG